MPQFRSVRAPSYDVDGLVSKLNEAASEGWDVVTVVPSSSDLVAILRKDESAAPVADAAMRSAAVKEGDTPAVPPKDSLVPAAAAAAAVATAGASDTKPADDLSAKVADFLGEDDLEKKATGALAGAKATEPAETTKSEPPGWGSAPSPSGSSAAAAPSPSTAGAAAAAPASAPGASPAPGPPAPASPSPGGSAPAAVTPGAGTTATTPRPATPAGWYPDPSGRYELRYWNGNDWSEHVARGGQQFTDPPVA